MLTNGDVYEVEMNGEYLGSRMVNVLHVKLIDDHTAAQLVTRAAAFATAWKDVFRAQQAAAFNWVSWKAQQVHGAGVAYSSSTCRRSGGDVYTGSFSGTLTGAPAKTLPLASTQAIVASFRTGRVGRSKNGRAFVGGWDEGDVAGNSMVPTTVALIQTPLTAFLAVYGDGGTDTHFEWHVFSRYGASGCRYVPALPRPILTYDPPVPSISAVQIITSASVAGLLAPMHRRKQGVGQ